MKNLYNYFEELRKGAGSLYKTYQIDTVKVETAVWDNTGLNSDSIIFSFLITFLLNRIKRFILIIFFVLIY